VSQRVSYGSCARCGKPILYMGSAYCSPQCNAAPARPRRSLDSETALARPGLVAPPLACVTWANERERGIVHAREAKEHVVRILDGDELIVGFHIAYDMTVFCAEWPDLIPKIFDVYAANRVSDTMWREKLKDIAEGTYHWGEEEDAKVRLNYNLAEVAYRRCRMRLEKGTWQLRFGELIDTPMAFWPLEAQQYAVTDAVATDAVWLDQEREDRERDVSYLEDEFRQARAYFWLQLMGCWGFHTDPESVRAFAQKAKLKYEALRDELLTTGLVTSKTSKKTGITKYTKKKAPVQELVRQEKQGKGQKVPLTKKAEKKLEGLEELLENEHVPAKRAAIERRIQVCLDSVMTDKDVCSRSDHPLLKKYADLSHYEHMLKSDVPLLEIGLEFPIHGKFDLANSGRTTSTLHFGKGNTQNWSTSNGMRECVMPRPGCVFAVGDYAGFELRTWSQVCLWMFGQTRMGQMLNAGLDPHLEMAARIMGISYEEAKADFDADKKGRVYLPRQTSKTGNFGLPGGLGPDRLVDYARKNYNVILTRPKAVELSEHWRGTWPEAPLYLDNAKRFMNSGEKQVKYFVSNRYRGDLRFTEYANGFFQALAADAAKASGFLIARACYAQPESVLYGSRPCMFIHDEFVLEVTDDEHAHDKAVELACLMVLGASPFLPDIPPVVDPLLCRRWSKAADAVWDQNRRLVPWVPKTKAAA
jgi:DNA polymerase family A